MREQKPINVDYSALSDLILEGVDYIKVELEKVKNGDPVDGDSAVLIEEIRNFLAILKQNNLAAMARDVSKAVSDSIEVSKANKAIESMANAFKAVIYFDKGCQMENIRAFAIINNLKEIAMEITYSPSDILENDKSIQIIREDGFKIMFKSEQTYNEILSYLNCIAFIRELELVQLGEVKNNEQTSDVKDALQVVQKKGESERSIKETQSVAPQSIISVNVDKLDKLMNLVGEMVIAETMVTQNSDLQGLELDSFIKASRQLRKITSEVQDVVMSIRMVPLTTTFLKMNRIVRDMTKKLNKKVEMEVVGQDTEVDKNIIEHISDPLMHLIRNAVDHGIETEDQRQKMGKAEPAKVIIEAKNVGSDVLIIVKDNGRGLDKEKILQRAREKELLNKPENEMSDKDIYNLIFSPGFSTKEKVNEFSGRGVGMDVVIKNIEAVGNSRYTIPITTIKESFRPQEDMIIKDPDGNEMVMVRGECYPILRLHKLFKVVTPIISFTEGILIMVENDGKIVSMRLQ